MDDKKRELRRQGNRNAVRQYRERKRAKDEKIEEAVTDFGKRVDIVEKVLSDLQSEIGELDNSPSRLPRPDQLQAESQKNPTDVDTTAAGPSMPAIKSSSNSGSDSPSHSKKNSQKESK